MTITLSFSEHICQNRQTIVLQCVTDDKGEFVSSPSIVKVLLCSESVQKRLMAPLDKSYCVIYTVVQYITLLYIERSA